MEKFKYILLFAVLLLAGCGQTDEEKTLLEKRKDKIEAIAYERAFKVGVMPTMDCLPLLVMRDSALYDTTKVDIRLKMYHAQMDCDEAMKKLSLQACVTDLVRAEHLKYENKTPLTYMTETNISWKLMVSPRSGIKSIKDMGDKVIALTRNSVTIYYTKRLLQIEKPKNNVYMAQINDVFVRLDMLRNNQLDAIWAAEPQATQARLTGNRILYDTAEDNFIPGAIVYVGKSDEKVRETFEKAYNKAVDLINKNSVQYYADIIKKYMKVDDNVVKALPELSYKHIRQPRQSDIMAAFNM